MKDHICFLGSTEKEVEVKLAKVKTTGLGAWTEVIVIIVNSHLRKTVLEGVEAVWGM